MDHTWTYGPWYDTGHNIRWKFIWLAVTKPLTSLDHGKELKYLPWLKNTGALPIYPIIRNSTKTRITWDFIRKKHGVLAFEAGWKIVVDNGTESIQRTFYQFCRNEVSNCSSTINKKTFSNIRIIRFSKFPKFHWKKTISIAETKIFSLLVQKRRKKLILWQARFEVTRQSVW